MTSAISMACRKMVESKRLKSVEEALPADDAGMQDGVGVRERAFADLAGFPSVRGNVERHIDHHGGADDVVTRNAAPDAAVVGIGTIVAHHDVAILGNMVWESDLGESERSASRSSGIGGAEGVRLVELAAVDEDGAVAKIDVIAGQADGAFDEIGGVRSVRRLEDNNLLALRVAPQRQVKAGEGHAGIVAQAAHDEVIADQQGVFHGA